MDEIDLELSRKIIKSFFNTSKPNITRISEQLGITRQTYTNYLDEMREKKIINGFTININPNIQPNPEHVIMLIKTNPNEPELIKNLYTIPELVMVDGIFGEFSLISLFIFRAPEQFRNTLKLLDEIMAESYFKKYQINETIKVYKMNGIRLSKKKLTPYTLDHIDYAILNILQGSQRSKLISTYDISKILKNKYKIDISQSTTYNRINRMEESGVILNYTINFCPKKLGFYGKFILRIKPKDPSKYEKLALSLEQKKEITHLYRIGSEFGLFAIVRVKQIENYGTFIKNLYDSGEIEDTYTNFVLDERVPFTNFVFN